MPDLKVLTQDEVIDVFLNRYSNQGGGEYVVTSRPDKIRRSEPQPSRDIDAIAEAFGFPPLAIEHTIVETRLMQKTKDAYFDKAFGPLNAELEARPFPFGVEVFIPIDGIQKGLNWQNIALAIRQYIYENAIALAFGDHEVSLPGVPFVIRLNKNEPAPNGSVRNGFGRYGVRLGDHDQFETILEDAIRNKTEPMNKYVGCGMQTVLLLETQDIATMNATVFRGRFNLVAGRVDLSVFDQVWMIRLYGPELLNLVQLK